MDTIVITDATDVPVLLEDGDLFDLPRGAVRNGDGTITLTLDFPFDLVYRKPGTQTATNSEHYAELTLRRMTGVEFDKIRRAKDTRGTALAISAGLTPAKLALLRTKMDPSDEAAADDIVDGLLGGNPVNDLPRQAERIGDIIRLPLMFPVHTEGVSLDVVEFKRITAQQRRQAVEFDNDVAWVMSYSAGLTPKEAKDALAAMDAADARAVALVVLFVRQWPADWLKQLGILGNHFGWSRSDLEALTLDDLRFWMACRNAAIAKG